MHTPKFPVYVPAEYQIANFQDLNEWNIHSLDCVSLLSCVMLAINIHSIQTAQCHGDSTNERQYLQQFLFKSGVCQWSLCQCDGTCKCFMAAVWGMSLSGHCWGHYPGTPPCSKVSATHFICIISWTLICYKSHFVPIMLGMLLFQPWIRWWSELKYVNHPTGYSLFYTGPKCVVAITGPEDDPTTNDAKHCRALFLN